MPNIEGTKQIVGATGLDDITRDRIRNSVVRVIEVLEEESNALRAGGAIDIDARLPRTPVCCAHTFMPSKRSPRSYRMPSRKSGLTGPTPER